MVFLPQEKTSNNSFYVSLAKWGGNAARSVSGAGVPFNGRGRGELGVLLQAGRTLATRVCFDFLALVTRRAELSPNLLPHGGGSPEFGGRTLPVMLSLCCRKPGSCPPQLPASDTQ